MTNEEKFLTKIVKKYKDDRVMTEWSTELFLENVIREDELNLSI